MKEWIRVACLGGFSVVSVCSCSDNGQTTSTSSSTTSSSGSNDSSSSSSSNSSSSTGGAGGMGAGGNAGSGGIAGMGNGGAGGMANGGNGGNGGNAGASSGSGGMGQGGAGGGSAGICGNGVLESGEACDDGNMQLGDGCNALCQFEAICGNGKKEPSEACDDGNAASGDGCSATCTIEMGTVCGGAIDLQNPTLVTKDGEVTTYNGTTAGSSLVNFSDPTCSSGTTGVPTVLHRYHTAPTLSRLIAKTLPINSPLMDPVLWMFSDCLNHSTETACNDDSGSGRHPKLRSPIMLPSTDVTFVLAGHNMSDVGPYQFVLTEQQLVEVPNDGTCEFPRFVKPHTLVTTAGVGTQKGTCTGDGAPEAILSLWPGVPMDLRITVTPESPTFDVGLYVRKGCPAQVEVACAEAGASGQSESLYLRNLGPTKYQIYVDGFTAQDSGLVQVDVETTPILPVGAPCDLTRRANRCVSTASCVGPTGSSVCKTHTVLFEEDFNVDLGAMTVVDNLSDGNSWGYCDPLLGCTQDNTTESLSGGGFALIKDKSNVTLDGEILRTAAVNTNGFGTVLLAFDHDFDHWDLSTDLARVEVSKDGTNWIPAVSYTLDATGSVVLDVSSTCANGSCRARFYYDDQTAGGDPFAEEWRVDDVRILGIP